MSEAIEQHTPATRSRAKPQYPDAELLALCAEFEARNRRVNELDAAVDHLPWNDPQHEAAYDEINALVARGWEIRAAVTDLPAHTREGLLAKARIALWETCDGDPEDGPCEGSDTAVAWSLARDVLRGRARA